MKPPRHWQVMLLWSAVVGLGWSVGPFLAAGTWRWPWAWAYFGVLVGGVLLHRRAVAAKNPELLERRREIGEGTKGWDLLWVALFWPQLAAAPVVAGFGVRLGWAAMPPLLFLLGVALYGAGMALSARAMAVNPFFEGTVRLQAELGQRPIDVGPYSRIRHPGYLGLIGWGLAQPFLLLCWEALAPAVLVCAWVVVRTVLEDRLLRRELAGYPEYAARVRWRLVPLVW